jgi:hypothetical protein
MYLIVDAALNWYFVRVVRSNLVKPGLKKYEALVRFNISIIALSLTMDVLIIGMMSLHNTFVYSKCDDHIISCSLLLRCLVILSILRSPIFSPALVLID